MTDHSQCCTPAPPADHDGVGKEVECGGLNVYINWPANTSTQAVVLAADVFGWETPLLRKLADKIAGAGFVTVVPDYFKGEPLDREKYPDFRVWLDKHPFETTAGYILTVVNQLKEKGITSVGVAGFCYGGKVAALVAKEGVLDASVLLHPSLVSVDDVKAMKGAVMVLAAEIDQVTPVELVEQYKTYLESQNQVEYFVKVNLGVAHGWTVRYDVHDEKAVKAAEEAHEDTIGWFKKHLK